ncbi:hypothetical protein OB905_00465 [Halobacteria archaeon AArc-dxtr1]|nr:hypothetical protein [Halobacteria archaeon AArc-dxtr1]
MIPEEIDIRHEGGALAFVAVDENGDETGADIGVGDLVAESLDARSLGGVGVPLVWSR